MAYLTEYENNYRAHRIKMMTKIKLEDSFPDFGGNWLESDTKVEAQMSEKEMLEFIKNALWRIRRWTTYHEHYCSRYELDEKKKIKGGVAGAIDPDSGVPAKARSEDAKKKFDETEELLRGARKLYNKDPNRAVLRPLDTTRRCVGFAPLKLYQTELSEYQDTINRLGYQCFTKELTKKITHHNGALPRWKIPPEEPRQPMLNAVPDGERLY